MFEKDGPYYCQPHLISIDFHGDNMATMEDRAKSFLAYIKDIQQPVHDWNTVFQHATKLMPESKDPLDYPSKTWVKSAMNMREHTGDDTHFVRALMVPTLVASTISDQPDMRNFDRMLACSDAFENYLKMIPHFDVARHYIVFAERVLDLRRQLMTAHASP